MDRRTLLTNLLQSKREKAAFRPPTISTSFNPYTGSWEYEQAAHLLRRSMFGPSHAQIKWSLEQGMVATVEKLFEELPMPDPPVNSYYSGDSKVPVGTTWVESPYSQSNLDREMSYRSKSLLGWTFGLLANEGISAREKLTLFWHNHFPINSVLDPKYLYRYINLLRSYAWGNFRDLTKAITIDPSMLIFLNGNRNTKEAPNENYARELLELFTIGKGPLVAPGDYTNYTEQDVKEIAKVLTGWRDYGFTSSNQNGAIGAQFNYSQHNTETKQLSYRFEHQQISDMGEEEYKHLVDIIFRKAETALFISRRLYRWFVYYEIDNEIELNIIQPMAQMIMDNDFVIKSAVKALLSSEHFYDAANIGAMVKSPLDFIMSIFKPLDIKVSNVLDEMYDSWYRFFGYTELMQMEIYNIPEVAGWKAYYLEPVYYRYWANAATLPVRISFAQELVKKGIFPFQANGPIMQPDVLKLLATLDNPSDPNALIEELAKIFLPQPLPDAEKTLLKQILIPGLPDYEWGVEYGNYVQNPNNSQLASSIRNKLRNVLTTIFGMAAFQLC